MNTGICRTYRGKHQAAIKIELTANTSLSQEQREEISSAGLPNMKKGDSAFAEPNTQVRFQLPPEEISSDCVLHPAFCCLVVKTVFYKWKQFKEVSYLCLKCGKHVFAQVIS